MIQQAEAEAVIPSKCHRKVLIPHDANAYRLRKRIEISFSKIERFQRIATRYDRPKIYFPTAIHLASAII